MENIVKDLGDSFHTSLIDEKHKSSEQYRHKLLYNDYSKGVKVLSNIISELEDCQEFIFSVAFITNSGIASLINTLLLLKEKGIKGKILTTNYLTFTDPKALRRLLSFDNIEVKVFNEGSFHTKGYLFKKEDHYTMIIGSSNLTANALSKNLEWNLKLNSMHNGELINSTLDEFNRCWNLSTVLTSDWIESYELVYKQVKDIRNQSPEIKLTENIVPNKMQSEALLALANLRDKGENKGLLISATGTGKTYLSAFDVRSTNPNKLLFVVHRENIARKAMESFKKVIGDNKTFGIVSGNRKDYDADYIFCTVQTMSKAEILDIFDRDHFGYIIIDEVHRAGAKSYESILNYFTPKFNLGMTATPERNDGFNIYEIFDYNIAYEIRLHNAMEEDLLCPFHYYGITDLYIDGKLIDDDTSFNHLTSDERVNHIIEVADTYGYDGDRVKGLIFCSRKDIAITLSDKFNKLGYDTIALTGSSSEQEREEAILRLEQKNLDNKLDYIFSVDIFNEGIDIPTINQVIMLRPTQSPIIFIQQLGRGLRKNIEKDHVVIIDFIGNYKNNYMIPIALYGDKSGNKDTLRKLINNGSDFLPGTSTINFDEIAKDRIYESINKKNFSTKKELKESYNELKIKLNRIPTLRDFVDFGSIDPNLITKYSKSYYNFLKEVEKDLKVELNEKEQLFLEFISREIATSKRPHELVILSKLVGNNKIDLNELYKNYNKDDVDSAMNIISKNFYGLTVKERFSDIKFIEENENIIEISDVFKYCLENNDFKYYYNDLIDYSKSVITFNEDEGNNLVLYNKYSRKDVCRLLNWDKDESATIFGYTIKHNTCPIFVTYHKEDDVSSSTNYDEKFISKQEFSWMTRNKVKLDSKEVIALKNYKETGLKIHLFIKKSDGEGTDFYYLGQVYPYAYIQKTIYNDKNTELPIVNVKFKLENEVREDVYKYLIK